MGRAARLPASPSSRHGETRRGRPQSTTRLSPSEKAVRNKSFFHRAREGGSIAEFRGDGLFPCHVTRRKGSVTAGKEAARQQALSRGPKDTARTKHVCTRLPPEADQNGKESLPRKARLHTAKKDASGSGRKRLFRVALSEAMIDRFLAPRNFRGFQAVEARGFTMRKLPSAFF